jgi:hypothetical protein
LTGQSGPQGTPDPRQTHTPAFRARLPCLIVLGIALIHGTLYLALVPPWGHYDEPTHFEYAWLIANRLRWPETGDEDTGLRREVAASMLEHGFYGPSAPEPGFLLQETGLVIGVTELVHPPLYYTLVALPLRVLRYSDVRTQLYLGRLVSLPLYLASIAIACALTAELLQAGHPLRWFVPATMALLPSYADLMTSINSDVGAVVALSLFLWGGVRAILRGLTVRRVIWLGLAALLCVYTKNTAAVAVLLFPLALLLGGVGSRWLRVLSRRVGRRRPALVLGAGVLALAALATVLLLLFPAWGNPALWYPVRQEHGPTSQAAGDAPLGSKVLALPAGGRVQQLLPAADVRALRGKTVTLGAWMWAAEPATVGSPSLSDDEHAARQRVELGTTPAFQAITTTVSPEATYISIGLELQESDPAQVIHYDGIVLVEGDRSQDPAPRFVDPHGRAGTWGGEPFDNRVRNASAEVTLPTLRPALERAIWDYTRRSPSLFLVSVLDGKRALEVYPIVVENLLQSFWARFGWNQISLPQGWYWALAAVTAWGAIGAGVGYLRLWRAARASGDRESGVGKREPERARRLAAWTFLGVAALLVWTNAFLRVHPLGARIQVPVARYAYPAIIPTVLALAGGWWTLTPRRFRPWVVAGLICALLALDGMAVWTLLQVYGKL